MRAIPQADAIGFAGRHIAEPAAQVTHNDIVRLDAKRRIAHAHAVTRRTLAGDGEKRIRDGERALERDGAGDTEEHEARAVSLARRTKTSRPESSRFVTKMTFPPRPPGVFAPKPSAPGKAGRSAARARIGEARASKGRRNCTTKAGRYGEFFISRCGVTSSGTPKVMSWA